MKCPASSTLLLIISGFINISLPQNPQKIETFKNNKFNKLMGRGV